MTAALAFDQACNEILLGRTEVDESLLTGESRAVARQPGQMVVAGAINLGAPVWTSVERLGPDTRYQQIVSLVRSGADETAVRTLVRDALRLAEDGGGVRCVLVGETLDYGAWWVQGYQSEAFAVRGDLDETLVGNMPIVVPGDHRAPCALSSSEDIEMPLQRLARRPEDS